jgi:hypothetical protein
VESGRRYVDGNVGINARGNEIMCRAPRRKHRRLGIYGWELLSCCMC